MTKNNTSIWFRKVRGSYLPTSFIGLVIYLLYVTYIVAVGIEWYRIGHDSWALLTALLPCVVAATVIVHWVASWHSK
jgi:hypothetical protein